MFMPPVGDPTNEVDTTRRELPVSVYKMCTVALYHGVVNPIFLTAIRCNLQRIFP